MPTANDAVHTNVMTHIAVAARDHRRLQEIGGVLARFGLADLLQRLRLAGLLPLPGRAAGRTADRPLPERAGAALEELGPVFVKLGQVLAARSDILPPEWTAALRRLHSRVGAVPYAEIAGPLATDLGGMPEDVFASFDPVPVAAGSIAQVYKARRHDGTIVAVKVQRPGIAPVIEADLRILAYLARVAEEQAPGLRRYRLPDIVRYLAAALRDELDFTREGRNADQVAAHFAGQPDIVIPRIHWDLSGPRVLVQDYMEGLSPADPAAVARAGLDPARIAARGTDAVLQMVFTDGLFHADPHPGNMLCLPGDRVGFIDFGMTGRVSPRRRDELITMIDAIVAGKGGALRDVLLRWAGAAEIDQAQLAGDADIFVARHGLPPLDFAAAIGDFMALARRHGIVMPADLALLLKALVTAEEAARTLDPDIDMIARAAPFVRGLALEKLSPEGMAAAVMRMLAEGRALSAEMPEALRGLMRALQRGRFALDMDVKGLEKSAAGIERAAMRLAVAIVTAAFILGLAPRLTGAEEEAFGFPVFTMLGLAATGAGIFWLALLNRRR